MVIRHPKQPKGMTRVASSITIHLPGNHRNSSRNASVLPVVSASLFRNVYIFADPTTSYGYWDSDNFTDCVNFSENSGKVWGDSLGAGIFTRGDKYTTRDGK